MAVEFRMKKAGIPNALLLGTLFIVMILSFARIYSRVKTIFIGYEIGRMREVEEQLLKKRSLLTMKYAKMTTRDFLESQILEHQRPNENLVDREKEK